MESCYDFKTVSTVGVNQIRPGSWPSFFAGHDNMLTVMTLLHVHYSMGQPRVEAGAMIWCRWKGELQPTQHLSCSIDFLTCVVDFKL